MVSLQQRPFTYQTNKTSHLNFQPPSVSPSNCSDLRPRSRDIRIHSSQASRSRSHISGIKSSLPSLIVHGTEEATTDVTKPDRIIDIRSPSNHNIDEESKREVPVIRIHKIDSKQSLVKKETEESKVIESHIMQDSSDSSNHLSVSSASFTQTSSENLKSLRSTFRVVPRKISFDISQVQIKLSDNLVSVVNEKQEDFDDYSYIDRLNSSINKSVKRIACFKPRNKNSDSNMSFEVKQNQKESKFKSPQMMTSFHQSPLKRYQTTLTHKRENQHFIVIENNQLKHQYHKRKKKWDIGHIFQYQFIVDECTLSVYSGFKRKERSPLIVNLLKHSLRAKGKKIYIPTHLEPNLEQLKKQISQIGERELIVEEASTHSKHIPLRSPSISLSHSSKQKSEKDSDIDNVFTYSITEQLFQQEGPSFNMRRHTFIQKSNDNMRTKLKRTSCKKIWLPKVLNVDPFIDELTRKFNYRAKQFQSSKKSQYEFLDLQLELNSFFARQLETKTKQLSNWMFLESSTFRDLNDETGIHSMQNEGPQTEIVPSNITQISSQNLAYLYYQHKELLSFLIEPPIACYYQNADSVLPIESVILRKRYIQRFRNLYEDVKLKSKRHIRASIFSQPSSPSPRSMDRQTSSEIVVEKILKVPIGSKGVSVYHGTNSIASEFEYDVMLDVNQQKNLISFYIPVNKDPQLRRKAIAPQNNSILEQPESLYSSDQQGSEFSDSAYSRADSLQLQYFTKKMQSHQHMPQVPYLARMKDSKILKSMENKRDMVDSAERKKPQLQNLKVPINLHVTSISSESWSPLHRNHPSDQTQHQFLNVDYENTGLINLTPRKGTSLFYRSHT